MLIEGRKYVKKALPEVIDVLYGEAESLHAAKNNKMAVRNYIARINPDYRITTDDGLFQKDDLGRYYLSGYPVVVPTTLLEAIRARVRSGASHSHLIEFWKLLMINPDADIRNKLFDYCASSETGFEITEAGYLLGYTRCITNHNIAKLEKTLRSAHRLKIQRDESLYMIGHGAYTTVPYGTAVNVGIVKHLYRDLFQDAFSKVREAQGTVFRTTANLAHQLQIGQITTGETRVVSWIDEEKTPRTDVIVMVMLNPAHVIGITPATVNVLECFPYGAVQKTGGDDGFQVIGETLLEVDYMQQDFYNMTSLLEEAQGLIGGRTTLLTPADIKRILDSRKIFVDKPKKE